MSRASEGLPSHPFIPLPTDVEWTMSSLNFEDVTDPDMVTLQTPGDLCRLSPILQLRVRILARRTLTSADLFRDHPGNLSDS